MRDEAPVADLLIATFSGRSLAASARAAGYRPLVADLFADNDLRDLAEDFRPVHGDFVNGFDPEDLLRALEELAAGRAPVGVVCGPGFEETPDLVDAIATRWRLFGNSGATIARLKDPLGFAALCAQLAIPHPHTQVERPADEAGRQWISKRIGAAGGLHIGYLDEREPAEDRYYQRFVEGERRSALFVAARGNAVVLALSEQWSSPCKGEPFRYGGACGPVRLGERQETAIGQAVKAIAGAVPDLVGLCSADFLVEEGKDPVLLEINPRPGATMDVFDSPQAPLLALHIDACNGLLPKTGVPHAEVIRAAGFAYLDCESVTLGVVDWPDFVSDRPVPGTTIRFGEPICTLKSHGSDARQAMAAFFERLASIKTIIEEPSS